jgi:hypothetical protein
MPKTNVSVKLTGQNGNIFNLVGIASTALKKKGYRQEAQEMREGVMKAKSYDQALAIIMDYVNVR